MKRLILSAGALALPLLAATAFAAEPPAMDEAARMSYALGYQLGRDLAGAELHADALVQGAQGRQQRRAGRSSTRSRCRRRSPRSSSASPSSAPRRRSAELEKALAGRQRLPAPRTRSSAGVKTTATGLQYKVVKAGTGRTPTPTDTVTVNYRGTLVDGTEFDSSYKRGEPATFPVAGVIAGLDRGAAADEGRRAVPARHPARRSPTATAARWRIPPGALLFDVELISVAPPGRPSKPRAHADRRRRTACSSTTRCTATRRRAGRAAGHGPRHAGGAVAGPAGRRR